MKEVPFFIDRRSPAGMKVYDIHDGPGDTGVYYPDFPSFLADRRRFLLSTPGGPAVCDPDDKCATRPVFTGTPPARTLLVSADGRYGYFRRGNRDETPLTITRVDLDSSRVEDVFHAAKEMPGSGLPVERFHPETVSCDHRRIASPCWLGDGRTPDAPCGIIVLDLESGKSRLAWTVRVAGLSHLRYCLSGAPEDAGDLLVQMNHGRRTDASGKVLRGQGPPAEKGVDVHVIRDDGSARRDLPFGRDGRESCIGHQVWRGLRSRAAAAVTLQNLDNSYGWADSSAQGVVAGEPVPVAMDAPHLGRLTPGARAVNLAAGFRRPRFCHLSCDDSGLRFAFDTFPVFDGRRAGMLVYYGAAASLNEPLAFRYLLNSGITFNGPRARQLNAHCHAHPVISPEGDFVLFNSDLTGEKRAYLATGFTG